MYLNNTISVRAAPMKLMGRIFITLARLEVVNYSFLKDVDRSSVENWRGKMINIYFKNMEDRVHLYFKKEDI